MKLNPALTKLRQLLEKKPEPGEPNAEATEVLNLLAGILACSVPGALMECSTTEAGDKKSVKKEAFTKALLACAEDSIRGILEEDGTVPAGDAKAEVAQLVELAKDIDFGENASFLAKVEAVAEGRVNSKIMDELMQGLDENGNLKSLGNPSQENGSSGKSCM